MSLRILHTESSLGWGGQEIRILTEAAGFLGRGHQAFLAAPAQSRIHREAARFGVPAIAVPIARKGLRGVLALRRVLSSTAVDVINSHSSTDSWLAALARASLADAPPLVRTRHVSAAVPVNSATRWLYVRATAHVATTGEAIRRQLIADNGFPGERISAVPTGIDASRFAPGGRTAARARLGLPAAVPIVGIVATLRSWKGHRYLVEAFAGLPDRDARLLIVGDGPQRAALQAQVAKLELGERVTFAGDQEDVVPWLQSLDLFALPSYANEGVPQALLQAMFCGIPCVTTDAGAIPEVATHGRTAWLVPREDAAALRAAIAALLADPAQRNRLAEAARAAVAQRFTLDAMLDRMEAIFANVAGTRARPAK